MYIRTCTCTYVCNMCSRTLHQIWLCSRGREVCWFGGIGRRRRGRRPRPNTGSWPGQRWAMYSASKPRRRERLDHLSLSVSLPPSLSLSLITHAHCIFASLGKATCNYSCTCTCMYMYVHMYVHSKIKYMHSTCTLYMYIQCIIIHTWCLFISCACVHEIHKVCIKYL